MRASHFTCVLLSLILYVHHGLNVSTHELLRDILNPEQQPEGEEPILWHAQSDTSGVGWGGVREKNTEV